MGALPDSKDFEDADKAATSNHFVDSEANTASIPGGNKLEDSLNVPRATIRTPSPDPRTSIHLSRPSNYFPDRIDRGYASWSLAPPQSTKVRIKATWYKNKGLFLVLIAQFFGTLMNITTRMLEIEGNDGKKLSVLVSAIANSSIR